MDIYIHMHILYALLCNIYLIHLKNPFQQSIFHDVQIRLYYRSHTNCLYMELHLPTFCPCWPAKPCIFYPCLHAAFLIWSQLLWFPLWSFPPVVCFPMFSLCIHALSVFLLVFLQVWCLACSYEFLRCGFFFSLCLLFAFCSLSHVFAFLSCWPWSVCLAFDYRFPFLLTSVLTCAGCIDSDYWNKPNKHVKK